MAKFICTIVLSFILVFPAFSRKESKQPQEPVIPADIQTILLEAGTLRPELTIDIYLKLISSGKIKSKSKQKQMLEEAFYLSFNAKEKAPRKIIAFEGQILTIRPTFISYAHKYKLDALSLHSRIVSEMLRIDSVRAIQLFNEISPNLSLKPLSCRDILLYETSEFYNLVGKIARDSFTAEKIKQGQRIAFLSPYIENATSPSQISPIAKMLTSIELTNDEMLNLAGTFSKSLRKISDDDRSFSYEMNFSSTGRDIFEFSRRLFFSPALYDEFRKSYKDYLTKNLQGNRCRDNVEYEERTGKVVSENGTKEIKLPFYFYEANKVFYSELPFDELEPAEIEPFTFPSEYLRFGKSGQIFKEVRKLQNWEEENKTASEIKESLEWQQAFSELLEKIDEWEKSDGEDNLDIFHQKSLIYRVLLREAPNFVLRESVVKKRLKLLNQNEIQREFVLEWFLGFNDLLNEIREIKPKEVQQKLFDVLKNSNNTAIGIYLDLEKILKSEKNESIVKTVTPSN